MTPQEVREARLRRLDPSCSSPEKKQSLSKPSEVDRLESSELKLNAAAPGSTSKSMDVDNVEDSSTVARPNKVSSASEGEGKSEMNSFEVSEMMKVLYVMRIDSVYVEGILLYTVVAIFYI